MYYHVWFRTRQSKCLLLGDVEDAVKQAIQSVASQHNIRLLECETMVDHVHRLVEARDTTDLSRVMHLLKGSSARRVLTELPDIRLDAGTTHLWQKRYGAKSVPPSALPTVRQYIRTQKDRPEKYER